MALISPSVIEEIKQLNIVDIVSAHVELVRRGNYHVGLCPFHMEKTPSFTVFEKRNNYKCYGCQSFGDSIKFIQEYKGLSFHDAVAYICENYGIELKYSGGGEHKSLAAHKKLHETVAVFAKEQLYSSKGKHALDYLYGRGFSRDLLEYFDIGFLSPSVSMDGIMKEYPDDVLKESGIFTHTRYGMKSFFENRILFPLRSYTGACIGFSGRSLDPEEKAKYKNSPETSLFSKRRELFNLHNAKDAMLKSKSCYLVEGYFDVMRMVEAGYTETVAIMGTALTKEQVLRLKNYVEEYNIILDGDNAGRKAMMDSQAVSLETNIYPYVAFLPPGEDPDTFIRTGGNEAFKEVLSKKEDLLLYAIKEERKKGTDDNRRFYRFEGVKSMLEKVGNVYRREYYLEEAARLFEINAKVLSSEINRVNGGSEIKKIHKSVKTVDFHCEKDFLCSLLYLSDESAFKLTMDMQPEHFTDEHSLMLFKKIVELFEQHGTILSLTNECELCPEMVDILSRDFEVEDAYRAAVDNKLKIILNYSVQKYHKLQDMIRIEKDPGEKQRLVKEWQSALLRVNQLKEQLKLV